MPLDGIALHAVTCELRQALVGGRVDRILQPEKDEIHLLVRSHGENYRLVLSASSNHARAHLTTVHKTNPLQAPMFCMLLRKRLIGGQIQNVEQPGLERILEIGIAAADELGVVSLMTLHTEIMGRHSNILLTDERGQIVDCIKHIDEQKSRVREALPGLPYTYPPAQDRVNPLSLEESDFFALLCALPPRPLSRALADRLQGLSQATARGLLAQVLEDPDQPVDRLTGDDLLPLARHLAAYYARVAGGDFAPTLLWPDGADAPQDFLPFPTPLYPNAWQQPKPTLSQAMEEYYAQRDLVERMGQRTGHMRKVVQGNLERCLRKLDKQRKTLLDSEKLEQYRLYGELLTTFQQQVPRGARQIDLPNYYDEAGGQVSIPLDPAKGANDNAQAYYKKYRKARVAAELVKAQMSDNLAEIDYLQGQLHNLSQCVSEADIAQIQAELTREGYLKAARSKGAKQLPPAKPYHYRSSDGFDIYVGRNNVQNDQLTFKMARGDDLWLHTLKIPGSHVIVRSQGGAVSPTAAEEAAMLAAWHSQARDSSGVPVDAAPRKLVKKPSGAKPGFVIYSGQTTYTVTADPTRIHALARIEE